MDYLFARTEKYCPLPLNSTKYTERCFCQMVTYSDLFNICQFVDGQYTSMSCTVFRVPYVVYCTSCTVRRVLYIVYCVSCTVLYTGCMWFKLVRMWSNECFLYFSYCVVKDFGSIAVLWKIFVLGTVLWRTKLQASIFAKGCLQILSGRKSLFSPYTHKICRA